MTGTSLPHSNFELSYGDLRKEIGWYLAFGRDRAAWDDGTKELIDSVLLAGLRQFYYPPIDKGYEWTFLQPTEWMRTDQGVWAQVMPLGFSSIVGDFMFDLDEGPSTLPVVGSAQIRKLRAAGNDETGRPQYAAIETRVVGATPPPDEGEEEDPNPPAEPEGLEGMRKWVTFWPEPDAQYILWYKGVRLSSPHELNPERHFSYDDTTQEYWSEELDPARDPPVIHDNEYPAGGSAHSETILASCLAMAEEKVNDGGNGQKANAFQRQLQASLAFDRRVDVPKTLGYCGDRSDSIAAWGNRGRYYDVDVLYNNYTAEEYPLPEE